MKKINCIFLSFLWMGSCAAQIPVTFTIEPSKNQKEISPYLFGVNAANGVENADDTDENIQVRRQGGNRLTGYNWENNASNAGQDYKHSNDGWLLSVSGIPDEKGEEPGIFVKAMHDKSIKMDVASVVTIPMAGYVAADKNGEVSPEETAPSPRWKSVKPYKGSKFSLQPDVLDSAVYIDEMVNFLITKYGKSTAVKGIKFYALDNEPALWKSTHPRLHPDKPRCLEMFKKSVQFAAAIKSVDPDALIFGGVFYGYSEHKNFQSANDWPTIKNGYQSYTEAFLDRMKHASDSIGFRLIDVLDFHWYPEARGLNNEGKEERICEGGGNDKNVAEARMQAPRSLWDTTYLEKSWITQNNKSIALLPQLCKAIDTYNPGTRIALTEFDYGGGDHISGGIALVDAFGVFAKYGVFMANYWKETNGYASAGYRIYRNYDSKKSTWGDVLVQSETSDKVNSSIYTAFSKSDTTAIHIILINKNSDQAINGTFNLHTGVNYKVAEVYQFNDKSPDIKQVGNIVLFNKDHSFNYTLPPLTVSHLVLKK